jgi:hypothetical protein
MENVKNVSTVSVYSVMIIMGSAKDVKTVIFLKKYIIINMLGVKKLLVMTKAVENVLKENVRLVRTNSVNNSQLMDSIVLIVKTAIVSNVRKIIEFVPNVWLALDLKSRIIKEEF